MQTFKNNLFVYVTPLFVRPLRPPATWVPVFSDKNIQLDINGFSSWIPTRPFRNGH